MVFYLLNTLESPNIASICLFSTQPCNARHKPGFMQIPRSSRFIVTAIIFGAVCITFLLWGHTLAARENPQPTEQLVDLVLDQAGGSFRFLIDGREVARIDRDGLHVRESIEYGGTITATGREYYEVKSGMAAPTPAKENAQ